MTRTQQTHSIEPVYAKNSRVLILGSFPSVKSREAKFFYSHPQNRFWRVLARLFDEPIPESVADKKKLLITHHIALWDVIKSCEIEGSSDTSISDVTPNDISVILGTADIAAIFCNGTKAYELYNRHIKPIVKTSALKLPSTSPANAACTLDKLCESWQIIKEYTN
ncbi:MAG: DNA-deoxyinosine glycosylase [Ruminococcus sp.]|nr:DNA-deoxyinosine glycosylase [Ruminococcus sp.]